MGHPEMAIKNEVEEIEQPRSEESQNNVEDLRTFAHFSQFSVIKPISIANPLLCSSLSSGKTSLEASNTLSQSNSKQVVSDELSKSTSYKRKRDSAMERAEEIQSKLESKFPSFVKTMLPSHVTGGFSLGFPMRFCESNLLKDDVTITLVDESGDEYPTKFLLRRSGLSAGWRGFSIAHKLVEGDALVFQLVMLTKFKVYIVRANDFAEVGACVVNLDPHARRVNAVEKDNGDKRIKSEGKHSRPVSLELLQEDSQRTSLPISVSSHGLPAEQSENHSEKDGSEISEDIRFSGSIVEFKDVKSIKEFTIIVNDLVIDSEIPKHLWTKYYELCCSQNAFLHDGLLEGINCKLVSGIISETVNIAEAIRACKHSSTSQDEFAVWGKSLRAFELLGMKVGFLRTRLHRLVSLSFESEETVSRYREARKGQDCIEEEIRTLDAKLTESIVIVDSLKVKAELQELQFQAEANAPW